MDGVLSQEEINALLVKKAKEYACVVRLKGGDVYVFGRGGEEGMFLREHGISFVIVPGVTSAIAGAAYAGIPVTHRGVATSFRVITAHNRHDETTDIDFATMLDPTETLVFLMGLGKVAEIAEGLLTAGRNPMTAVAVISHATTPQQKTCIGNLTNIADRVTEARLTSPAIIVVGNVVNTQHSKNSLCGENITLFRRSEANRQNWRICCAAKVHMSRNYSLAASSGFLRCTDGKNWILWICSFLRAGMGSPAL